MRGIEYLTRKARRKAKRLIRKCEKTGLHIFLTETYRTVYEQDELYAKGRTKPGTIVTYAKGSDYQSMHQWGIAFDFARRDSKNPYDNSDGFFDKVGAVGKSIGLIWGGDWTSPVDKPHFHLKKWGNTPLKLKMKYGKPDNFFKTIEGRRYKS